MSRMQSHRCSRFRRGLASHHPQPFTRLTRSHPLLHFSNIIGSHSQAANTALVLAGLPTSCRRGCIAQATSTQGVVDFPLELPVFPVQPLGVFIPGMTKTLHLYESHFLELLEEAVAHPSGKKLMCIAVMEPYLGKPEQAASLGSYIGGSNCVFSCACLVQVLNVRPFMKGMLVQIRGEARVAFNTVLQVDPYVRARVYSLPDPVPTPRELSALPVAVEQLDEVMRDVQMLAAKFRCDETAAIQQAFRYVNERPLVANIQEPLPEPPGADQAPVLTGDDNQFVLYPPSMDLQGMVSHADRDGEGQGFFSDGQIRTCQTIHNLSTDTQCSLQHQQQQKREMSQVGQQQSPHTQHCPDECIEELDLQRASRLSYASLQWLPESTAEERYEVLRGRLLAMDVTSLSDRLEVVTVIMSRARSSLAAKCALIALPYQG